MSSGTLGANAGPANDAGSDTWYWTGLLSRKEIAAWAAGRRVKGSLACLIQIHFQYTETDLLLTTGVIFKPWA